MDLNIVYLKWHQTGDIHLGYVGIENGGLPPQELALMACVFKAYEGELERALEIGTFQGVTTCNLAAWIDDVVTVDIPPEEENANPTKERHLTAKLFDILPMARNRVTFLELNSNTLLERIKKNEEPEWFFKLGDQSCRTGFDFVFVDGDHTYETVVNDTELAFICDPEVVFWHDYGRCDGVTRYIDELISGDKPMPGGYHPPSVVNGTKFAVWEKEPRKMDLQVEVLYGMFFNDEEIDNLKHEEMAKIAGGGDE